MDVDYQAGEKGLKYAAEKGLAVVIMEPIRGGRLVDPPQQIQAIWDKSKNPRSPVDWSLQWLWNQPEVSVVLSGMSDMQQVVENVNSARSSGINTLTEQDLATVSSAKRAYEDLALIPCTRCGYCIPCPEGIDIPGILTIYNDSIMYDKFEYAKTDYTVWVPDNAKANLCVACTDCEEKCPQDIQISEWMPKIHGYFTEE
jgi:predicted aldo/keto reductase-like oxidoreductase